MAHPAGFEPATIRLEGGCSIQLSYGRLIIFLTGRGREIRTPDILLPKQARYQTALYPEISQLLSGNPENFRWSTATNTTHKHGARQLPYAFFDPHSSSDNAGNVFVLMTIPICLKKNHHAHPLYRTDFT